MFAEIVRSRFDNRRKTARSRGGAAGGDDHRAHRRSDRASQPALLSAPARQQDQTATETGEPFALGLIDLDGFKPINDAYGHPVGDEILRQVGDRLAKAMDGRGSAARIGGDEFAIICDAIGARDEAVALGEKIQSIFATPFAIQRLNLRLTSACGLALFPSSSGEPNDLVRVTDAALYRAKAIGHGGAVVFNARAASAADGGARLEEALKRTIFEPEAAHFQPNWLRQAATIGAKWPSAGPGSRFGQPIWTGTLTLGAFAELRAVDQVSR